MDGLEDVVTELYNKGITAGSQKEQCAFSSRCWDKTRRGRRGEKEEEEAGGNRGAETGQCWRKCFK